jgi:hypothetical protein
MSKLLSLILIVLVSVGVSAGETLNCDLQQNFEGEVTGNSFQVEATDNPHGSMFMFNADKFAGVSGFVARIQRDNREFVVMNIYSQSLQVGSSSQHEVIAGSNQYFHHQLLLPSQGLALSGVIIDCQF